MIRIDAVLARFPGLAAHELIDWVERHWVVPETDADEIWLFSEIDVARVGLIYDLRRDLDVAEETVPMMLALLDQIYELRRVVKCINRAVADQPPEVRATIAQALAREMRGE